MADKFFWADKIADEIIKRNPKKKTYVCASGITPSGNVHIGNFREVITTELVVRALQDKGKKVKFIYSWDDYDRFRKIPAGVSKSYEKFIGMPISEFSSPFDKSKSYAEFFEKEFENSLKEVNVSPTFVRQSLMNKKCKYAELIKQALDKKELIRKILDKYRKEPLEDNWFPVIVYCEKCMKDFTKIIGFENYEIEYGCKCGHKDKIDFRKKGLVKLQWRVDWPARWKYEEVDFEPGGIDHSTPGGSFTTAKEIVKEIYDYQIPLYQFYEWVRIKGGIEFSSSKGNATTLKDVLEIYEPEVLRYIFAGTRPNKGFQISFDEDVIKIYEDFDNLEERYFSGELDDQEKRIYEMSIVKIPRKKPERISFRHLISVVQSGKKIKDLRTEKVKNWLEKHASENWKFEIQTKLGKLNSKEKEILTNLKKLLEKNLSEKELANEIYEIPKKLEINPKDFFEISYKNILGKEKGPRLAGLLYSSKKEVLELLKKIK